jgi:N-glycosylase/DNA lyase
MDSEEIKELYSRLKPQIDSRLTDFRRVWEKGDEKVLFEEMTFCLLTPQSKAKTCWKAVECMKERDILFSGTEESITDCLVGVRFKYTKAKRIRVLMDLFPEGRGIRETMDSFESPYEAREWLVKNMEGYGYKEASHFLRNTGYGLELAILDRHILRNLESAGVISEMPKTLTRKAYLDIEERMREFSEKIDVPMPALDLIFWYEGAGEIFK